MTIPTGVMQLLKAEPLDVIEDFENGLAPDGGEWTNWERLSAHNHGGGLLGAPITVTAAMIPDGSITAGKLDPSVLAPYALTDGTKPFTGQVTMQADAVIRDTLLFGEQGTALAPDAILARTGPGGLRLTGVRSTLAALDPGGTTPARYGQAVAGRRLDLTINAWHDGANWQRDDPSLPATSVALNATDTGSETLLSVTAVPAGVNPIGTFISRLTLNRLGTLSPVPDAGQPALATAAEMRLQTTTGSIVLNPAGGSIVPNSAGYHTIGSTPLPFAAIHATNGTIQTSDPAQKTDVVPIDPAAALETVLGTTVIEYDLPAPTPEDPAATMRHVGYDASVAPPLLRVRRRDGQGREVPTEPAVEANTTASVGVAAVQALHAEQQALAVRVAALEALEAIP